ncbi:MAG: hypothetical protein R3303_05690 [Marinobacter sp.]|nr:hypothetical protein [Marinobacter sp.]
MDSIKNWWNQNVDKKQLTTIVVASAVVGGLAYAARSTGFAKIGTVVKGG